MTDEVQYLKTRDESTIDLAGNPVRVKYIRFMIGTFGPFDERIPNDDNWNTELQTRIAKLRQQLATLPR